MLTLPEKEGFMSTSTAFAHPLAWDYWWRGKKMSSSSRSGRRRSIMSSRTREQEIEVRIKSPREIAAMAAEIFPIDTSPSLPLLPCASIWARPSGTCRIPLNTRGRARSLHHHTHQKTHVHRLDESEDE